MSKKKIDYSDIPETNTKFWKKTKIMLPQKKKLLTLRLDSEIIDWFKEEGKGYQTKINAVLKSYVRSHQQHSRA